MKSANSVIIRMSKQDSENNTHLQKMCEKQQQQQKITK